MNGTSRKEQAEGWKQESRLAERRMWRWMFIEMGWLAVLLGITNVVSSWLYAGRTNEPVDGWFEAVFWVVIVVLFVIMFFFVRAGLRFGWTRRRWREAADAAGVPGPGDR